MPVECCTHCRVWLHMYFTEQCAFRTCASPGTNALAERFILAIVFLVLPFSVCLNMSLANKLLALTVTKVTINTFLHSSACSAVERMSTHEPSSR